MKGRRTGCTNCRQRHSRCVVAPGSSSCNRCLETETNRHPCRFENRFAIREVKHVYNSTASESGRSKFRFTYNQTHTWVPITGPIRFLLEDGIHELAAVDKDVERTASSISADPLREPLPVDSVAVTPAPPQSSFSQDEEAGKDAEMLSGADQCHMDDFVRLHLTKPLPKALGSFPHDSSSAANTHTSSPMSVSLSRSLVENAGFGSGSLLSKREAFLLRSYVENLAPWADVCDPARHFGYEVPRRCLRDPLILYGVLGLSSRHQSIITGANEVEASHYHGACLELVISKLSTPEDSYDDNLLAGIVLLRLYEELESRADSRCHLLGASQLLNTMATFSSSGGLAEAASWISLRQAIYATLVQKAPMEIRLENYNLMSLFQLGHTEAHTNAIILIMGQILSCINSTSSDRLGKQSVLEELKERAEDWNRTKPLSFEPIYYGESGHDQYSAFPDIRMLNTPEVVGLQYYHGAKILFEIHSTSESKSSGYQAAREARERERKIHSSLVIIISLAMSNPFVENAFFTASHFCSYCGYCLTDPLQREQTIRLLLRTENAMGWRTMAVIDRLQEQWRDLDML